MRLDDYREFHYSNLPVRTRFENNQVWFVAKDVAKVLNLVWNGKDTIRSIPDYWTRVRKFHTPSGEQDLYVINEAGLYKLTFRSNKPEAEKFTNWVCETVLPEIRKTGSYQGASQIFGNLTTEENKGILKRL